MVIDQDTWVLNVAQYHDARWIHYCQIRLPAELTEQQACERASHIRQGWAHIGHWFKFDLTRWEMRGYPKEL